MPISVKLAKGRLLQLGSRTVPKDLGRLSNMKMPVRSRYGDEREDRVTIKNLVK